MKINPSEINILVGCEESQAVLEQLLQMGFNAYSNDILPTSGKFHDRHLQMDIYDAIKLKKWHAGFFFTPCTYSCNSGIRWMFNKDGSINQERLANCNKYASMLRDAINSEIQFVSCENPIPHRFAVEVIGRKYDQVIQPWQFGHGEQKATCLWLKNLPKLIPTEIVEGREQRIWKLPPTEDRGKLRSKTFPGIAKAMAEQWGNYILIELNKTN